MTETEARDINGLISSESLEQDSTKRLLESELLHRAHQVRQFDRLKYALTRDGEDHAAAFKRLSADRDDLEERFLQSSPPPARGPRPGPARSTLADSRLDLVAPRLGRQGEGPFVFGSEGCVPIPRASDGISVVPAASAAHGEIVTTGLGSLGNISFHADNPINDPPGLVVDSTSGKEQIWLRNWRYVVLFPCVSTASDLTYRFTVNVNAQIFRHAARGLIMAFASVGEEPSASPTSQIDVDTPVGWMLIADVEEQSEFYNGHYGFKNGSLAVERTFEVGAGRTPAVAIVVGFVVRLTSGGLRLSFLGDSGIGFSGLTVCYRYTPILVHDPT